METTTIRFCRKCEHSFSGSNDVQVCPQCGDVLVDLDRGTTVEVGVNAVRAMPEMHSISEDSAHQEMLGRQIANYRIEQYLGRGGMAHVFRATHLTLHRPCAIKLFRPTKVNRASHPVDSFLAEARSAAALVHPHVVTIHTIGSEQDQHYIEMEYVAGRSLANLLETEQALDVQRATRLMVQISSALAAAHQMRMIHRDVKPANVMLTASGDAKLADFGLAKQLASAGQANAEQAEPLCGTPNYMAPELFAPQPASKQSDVYAMGVTYYSLITGRLPLDPRSLNELIQLHASHAALDIDSICESVPSVAADVLRRCLAYDPGDRFQDAAELFENLCVALRSLRSLRSLLEEALSGEELTIHGDEDLFFVKVPLAEGRSQTVRVEERRDVETDERIIRIMSVCARATVKYYEKALQLNAAISHGSLGIAEVDGEPHFVMTSSYPWSTCDPEEVYKSVLSIARHSDAIELKLTGDDRF